MVKFWIYSCYSTCVLGIRLYSKTYLWVTRVNKKPKLQPPIVNYPSHWPSEDGNITSMAKMKTKTNLQRGDFFVDWVADCTLLEVMGQKQVQIGPTHHFVSSESTLERKVTRPTIWLDQSTTSLCTLIRTPHYQKHTQPPFITPPLLIC